MQQKPVFLNVFKIYCFFLVPGESDAPRGCVRRGPIHERYADILNGQAQEAGQPVRDGRWDRCTGGQEGGRGGAEDVRIRRYLLK